MLSHTFRLGLAMSTNKMKTMPYEYVHRTIWSRYSPVGTSQMVLDCVKLTTPEDTGAVWWVVWGPC